MPRPTKTFLKLTNEVNPKLLTSEETKERLKVFSQLMDQYSRTRHSDRKKKYKSQLTTVFQRICLQLEDSARDNKDLEAEVTSLEERLAQKQRAVEKAQTQECRAQCRLDRARDWEGMYNEQLRANRRQDSAYAQLLRENAALESKLETAKKRIKRKN